MMSAHLTTAHHSSPAGRISAMLRKAIQIFTLWQARRATREMLRALDVRTLKDIGIDPNEIESMIYSERNDRRRGYDPNWRRR
jgi:uncharacterized protein YjiS (DUF1127 family)